MRCDFEPKFRVSFAAKLRPRSDNGDYGNQEKFAFRLNDGNVKVPTLARLDALVDGTIGKRLTYKGLIAKEGN